MGGGWLTAKPTRTYDYCQKPGGKRQHQLPINKKPENIGHRGETEPGLKSREKKNQWNRGAKKRRSAEEKRGRPEPERGILGDQNLGQPIKGEKTEGGWAPKSGSHNKKKVRLGKSWRQQKGRGEEKSQRKRTGLWKKGKGNPIDSQKKGKELGREVDGQGERVQMHQVGNRKGGLE